MVQHKMFIIDTSTEVTFELSDSDDILFRFVNGLITREEAEMELKKSLDYYDLDAMRTLAHYLVY